MTNSHSAKSLRILATHQRSLEAKARKDMEMHREAAELFEMRAQQEEDRERQA